MMSNDSQTSDNSKTTQEARQTAKGRAARDCINGATLDGICAMIAVANITNLYITSADFSVEDVPGKIDGIPLLKRFTLGGDEHHGTNGIVY